MQKPSIFSDKLPKDWEHSISDFLAFLKLEKSLSKHSVWAYERDVRRLGSFITTINTPLSPTQVTQAQIEKLLQQMGEVGLDAKTQARCLSGIKSFYKFLVIEERIITDPTELIEGPRIGQTIPDVLTYNEVCRILEAIDLSEPNGIRNRAIIETLYGSGLRVSELCNLKLSNLFMDLEIVKVQGKGSKERLVPLSPDAMKYIEQYLQHIRSKQVIKKEAEDIVFLNRRGAALTRVMIFLIIKELAQKAEVRKNISPHTFRHSFATHLIEGGANLRVIQDLLGHESIVTTEIYTHLNIEYLREAVQLFHPINTSLKDKIEDALNTSEE